MNRPEDSQLSESPETSELETTKESLAATTRQLRSLEIAYQELAKERGRTLADLHCVLHTFSWRITAPLRFIKKAFAACNRKVSRAFERTFRPPRLKAGRLAESWIEGASAQTHPFVFRDFDSMRECRKLDKKIAVHLHLYYADLLPEFQECLSRVPFPFDLFVSVAEEAAQASSRLAFSDLPMVGELDIRIVPNKGRDMAPFYVVFGDRLKNYDFISHIHTKKSLYNNGATMGWREYMLDNLFGSKKRLRQIFHLLATDPKVGMVYPQSFERVPYPANSWLANREDGLQWCERLNIDKAPGGYFHFPAGSMFWARTEALRPLFEAGISWEEFPEETAQSDGTLAHTLERLSGVVPVSRGYQVVAIQDKKNPRWSPWGFEQYLSRPGYSIFENIRNPRIRMVIFDIFDTVVTRPLLDPESIKRIVAGRVPEPLGRTYLQWRARAEETARKEAGRDIGLDEIFSVMADLAQMSGPDVETLRVLEEAVERESVSPRKEIVDLVHYAQQQGKRLVFASDTFLPRATVEEMLSRAGISGWQSLYVSSEIGLRKDTSQLYTHILNEEQLTAAEAMVIGDNERSDLQIPSALGIFSLHILKPADLASGLPGLGPLVRKVRHSADLNEELTLGLVVRRGYENVYYPGFSPQNLVAASPESIGYSVVGPLVTAFAHWLVEQTAVDGIRRLYFLSRDGLLLKDVYDRWASQFPDAAESRYLRVSRRALLVPSISGDSDLESFTKTDYAANAVDVFLRERFGVELGEDEWKAIYAAGLWKKNKPVSIRDRRTASLKPLLEHLRPKILARSESERRALRSYLRENGLDDKSPAMAVVDVGYSATMQSSLVDLCAKKIHGYYLMTTRKADEDSMQRKVHVRAAAYRDLALGKELPVLFLQSFKLEKFLSWNEQQVLYYEERDGAIEPVYRELSEREQGSGPMREAIKAGVMQYVEEACEVRKRMVPDFAPSLSVGVELMETFFRGLSGAEKGILDRIVIDDHYCGRDLQ